MHSHIGYILVFYSRFLLLWTSEQSNKQSYIRNIYSTSFRCNRNLFRWYTNLNWWRYQSRCQNQNYKKWKLHMKKRKSGVLTPTFQTDYCETMTLEKFCWIIQISPLPSPPPHPTSPFQLLEYQIWWVGWLIWYSREIGLRPLCTWDTLHIWGDSLSSGGRGAEAQWKLFRTSPTAEMG